MCGSDVLQQPIFTSISLVRWVSQRVSEQASEREREKDVFSSDAGPHCHGMSRCEEGSSDTEGEVRDRRLAGHLAHRCVGSWNISGSRRSNRVASQSQFP